MNVSQPSQPSTPVGTDYSHQLKKVMASMRAHLIEHPNQWQRVSIPMSWKQASQVVYRVRRGRPPWNPKGSWQADTVKGQRAGVWHIELRHVPDVEADPFFVQGSTCEHLSGQGPQPSGLPSGTPRGVTHTTLGKDDCPPTDGFVGLSSESPAAASVLVSDSGERTVSPTDRNYTPNDDPVRPTKRRTVCPLCLASDHGYCTAARCTCGCVPR